MTLDYDGVLLQFSRALEARDIIPPRHLMSDGKLHRCDAKGRNGKGDAAYILFVDSIPAGGLENHRDGRGWENWRADVDRVLTLAEQEQHKKRMDAARLARAEDDRLRRAEAAARADAIWQDAEADCSGNPYIARKGIAGYGVRILHGKLIVPVRDLDGGLHSLQFIDEAGGKGFLTGGRVRGCSHLIGELGGTIIIAEGYATAATVHLATGHGVAVAFDAGNLPALAAAVRVKHPNARIVIAADDDHRTDGNPGLTKAREAAVKVGGIVAVPDFRGIEQPTDATDFNDMAQLVGLDAVRERIAAATAEPPATPTSIKPVSEKLSQRDKLIVVADRARVWRCIDGVAHSTIPVGQHIEHHRVRSSRFREWLSLEAGRDFPMIINSVSRPSAFGKNAIEDALGFVEALAAASGTIFPAALRVTQHDDCLYLDLGGPDWRAVKISVAGWRIVDTAPVPLLRTRRTRALPVPVPDGSLAPLYELLPIDGDDEKRLAVLWLLAALRPTGPYPIIAWSGEQGTGKSFASRVLRRLVDPAGDDVMQPPREDRDLIAAARGNHVLAFDNLSSVSSELGDSLCRLSSGGDIGGRQLYTDNESASFAASRPIILNGIPDLTSRGDLASRALFLRLSPMLRRRTEADLWRQFDAVAPGILGRLLTVLSSALARLPDVQLPDDSAELRMADFAVLAIAAEPALGWPPGSALAALHRNTQTAATALADLDSVAVALRGMVDQDGSFIGLVSTLYRCLNERVDPDTRRSPLWPKHPARLGEHLRRLSPALRAAGIEVVERRGKNGMTVEISPRRPGVGEGTSLFKHFKKEEREEGSDEEGDSGREPTPPTPLSPTASAKTAETQSVTPNGAGVGGVGATYTTESPAGTGFLQKGVGGVGNKPSQFTRPDAGRIKL